MALIHVTICSIQTQSQLSFINTIKGVTSKDVQPDHNTYYQTPGIEQLQTSAQPAATLSGQAYPNPSTHSFTLTLKSSNSTPVVLTVRDVMGRVIERRTGVAVNARLSLGSNYRPGVYHAELAQGTETRTLKLLGH